MSEKMSRRDFLKFGSLVFGGVTLAACKREQPGAPVHQTPEVPVAKNTPVLNSVTTIAMEQSGEVTRLDSASAIIHSEIPSNGSIIYVEVRVPKMYNPLTGKLKDAYSPQDLAIKIEEVTKDPHNPDVRVSRPLAEVPLNGDFTGPLHLGENSLGPGSHDIQALVLKTAIQETVLPKGVPDKLVTWGDPLNPVSITTITVQSEQ